MFYPKPTCSRAAVAAVATLFISTCYLLSSVHPANKLQQLSQLVKNPNSLINVFQYEEFYGNLNGKFRDSKLENESWKIGELSSKEVHSFNLGEQSQPAYGDGPNNTDAVTMSGRTGPSYEYLHEGRKPTLLSAPSSWRVDTTVNSSTPGSVRFELDLSRGAWAPWPRDPECRASTVHFGRHIPVRALASFPGSGNTWVRYLVEGATGLHTGSVYDDSELYLKGFRGEKEQWDSGTTVLQKTHDSDDDDMARFDGRTVLLIRNPYRALLSYSNFFASGGHKGHAPVAFYSSLDWAVFVRVFLRRWLLTAKQWLTKGTSVHVLHYELLRENVTASITDLLHHLGLPVDLHRLRCLQKHSAGHFRRPRQYLPDNLAVFSRGARDMIERAIHYVDHLLRERRQHELPLHLYEFYNKTASSSIIRVPCAKSESQHDCNIRTDDLNRGASRSSDTNSA